MEPEPEPSPAFDMFEAPGSTPQPEPSPELAMPAKAQPPVTAAAQRSTNQVWAAHFNQFKSGVGLLREKGAEQEERLARLQARQAALAEKLRRMTTHQYELGERAREHEAAADAARAELLEASRKVAAPAPPPAPATASAATQTDGDDPAAVARSYCRDFAIADSDCLVLAEALRAKLPPHARAWCQREHAPPD